MNLRIELNEFSKTSRGSSLIRPKRYVLMKGFVEGELKNNLALIQLNFATFLPGQTDFFLPPCESRALQGDIIATCGMGQFTFSDQLSLGAPTLQEGFFSVNYIKPPFVPFVHLPHFCEDELICNDPVVKGTNICTYDEGSPLYQFECSSYKGYEYMRPKCVYGIASHYVREEKQTNYGTQNTWDNKSSICQSGSAFTNVTHYIGWIRQTLGFFNAI
ncbi:uncharacterized protein LOC142335263 isoform X2 [Convolutriloba macropyga]